jgi:hypothetical protein
MTKTHSSEQAALVDFFRRGDAYAAASNSLEPPMMETFDDLAAGDDESRVFLRTPEQEARRRTCIRLVSGVVTVLAVGTVLAIVGSWLGGSTEAALAATEPRVEAATRGVPLAKSPIPAKVEKPPAPVVAANLAPAELAVKTPLANKADKPSAPVVGPTPSQTSAAVAAKSAPVAVAKTAALAAPGRTAAPTSARVEVASSQGEVARRVTAVSRTSEGANPGSSRVTTSSSRPRRIGASRPTAGDYRPPTAVFED